MRTDDLVAMLATGIEPVDNRALARRNAMGMGAGLLAAFLLMVFALGIRKDLASAVWIPMFWVKLAFPASLAAAAFIAARRLSIPGVQLGRISVALIAPVAAMWLLATFFVLGAADAERPALIMGRTFATCPVLIAMVSLPIFTAAMWIMRGFAPTHLPMAGAAAGLMAGASGAFIYAWHCPEMSPAFLAVWYLLGMLVPALVGGLIGPRVLRW